MHAKTAQPPLSSAPHPRARSTAPGAKGKGGKNQSRGASGAACRVEDRGFVRTGQAEHRLVHHGPLHGLIVSCAARRAAGGRPKWWTGREDRKTRRADAPKGGDARARVIMARGLAGMALQSLRLESSRLWTPSTHKGCKRVSRRCSCGRPSHGPSWVGTIAHLIPTASIRSAVYMC